MTKRSSFNVSLQRKHNKIVLGPLIERSEQDGSVISDIIVEYVEKALDYEKVVGLNKVMQTYKLIQNMVAVQHDYGTEDYYQRIEDVLKRIIRIDGNELSMFLSDPTGYSGESDIRPLPSLPNALRSTKQSVPVIPNESVSENPNDSESPLDREKNPNPNELSTRTSQSYSKIEDIDDVKDIKSKVDFELDLDEDEEDEEIERLRKRRAEERKRKKNEKEALLKRSEPNEDLEDLEGFDIESLNTGALFND